MKDILFYILYLILPKQEDIYIKEYMLDTEYVPTYIYWIDDSNVLLSSYGYTQLYNISNRRSNTLDTCDRCIYGYDYGFVYCKYEHREINSMEEFSTSIYQYSIKDEILFSKEIFPTVIPTVCTREYIVLKTADPVLVQKEYILDIPKSEYYESQKKQSMEGIKGVEDGYITISKSKDRGKLIVLDQYYRVWVYVKR